MPSIASLLARVLLARPSAYIQLDSLAGRFRWYSWQFHVPVYTSRFSYRSSFCRSNHYKRCFADICHTAVCSIGQSCILLLQVTVPLFLKGNFSDLREFFNNRHNISQDYFGKSAGFYNEVRNIFYVSSLLQIACFY